VVTLLSFLILQSGPKLNSADLNFLHRVAAEVTQGAKVESGASIPGVGVNTTGFALRVPGATQSYYPAFWVRDAAMMLGGDLVPPGELSGWIKVIARTQPGPEGIHLPHNMFVPGYSIPDHVTLHGEACWYPGAYAEQGVGDFGLLPPADDAFYFVQMVHEHYRLTKSKHALMEKVDTGYGPATVLATAERAFDSVEVTSLPLDKAGLVMCQPGQTRVDWGFCDSIRKTGVALMPSLLRWQAARRMVELERAVGDSTKADSYRKVADEVQKSLNVFFEKDHLVSATGWGRQDDVWATAFAVWLGVFPRKQQYLLAHHLLTLYKERGIVSAGQVRGLPSGTYWDHASSGPDTYQNGGFWATPTGWFVSAIDLVDHKTAQEIFTSFIEDLKTHRHDGAPYEWTNPSKSVRVNGQYGSSAGLVYIALTQKPH
jgi:hypothetical protein